MKTTGILKNEAQYNTKTKKGTYSHVVRHSELVLGAKIINDAPTVMGQKLASRNDALRLLYSRYKKK